MGILEHYECNTSFGIFHNDLWKDNIMLHFLPNKLDIVYIGVYDWGEAR